MYEALILICGYIYWINSGDTIYSGSDLLNICNARIKKYIAVKESIKKVQQC